MKALFELGPQIIVPGLVILRGMADSTEIFGELEALLMAAPLRHQTVPGGRTMAIAQSNCGDLGWTADALGYRYTAADPFTGRPWPKMPAALRQVALAGAQAAGYPNFEPDACLTNVYTAGTQLGLHRDNDEADLTQPIVSVSLGATARFIIGGLERGDPVKSFALDDGDVMVLAGEARFCLHGVRPLKVPASGAKYSQPINLTFRKAG